MVLALDRYTKIQIVTDPTIFREKKKPTELVSVIVLEVFSVWTILKVVVIKAKMISVFIK